MDVSTSHPGDMMTTKLQTALEKFGVTEEDLVQSLLNLSLIEDGHPSHLSGSRFRRANPDEKRPDKADEIALAMKEYRRQSMIVAVAILPWNRKEAAAKASEALEKVIFLLTTYSFDCARRFAIIHFALRPIAADKKAVADPFLALKIRDEDETINNPDIPSTRDGWLRRARIVWSRLDAWHDRIDHEVKERIDKAIAILR